MYVLFVFTKSQISPNIERTVYSTLKYSNKIAMYNLVVIELYYNFHPLLPLHALCDISCELTLFAITWLSLRYPENEILKKFKMKIGISSLVCQRTYMKGTNQKSSLGVNDS